MYNIVETDNKTPKVKFSGGKEHKSLLFRQKEEIKIAEKNNFQRRNIWNYDDFSKIGQNEEPSIDELLQGVEVHSLLEKTDLFKNAIGKNIQPLFISLADGSKELPSIYSNQPLNMITNETGLDKLVNQYRKNEPHFTLSEYNGRRRWMVLPYQKVKNSEYRVGGQYYHPGIDVGLAKGTELTVPLDGKVVEIVVDNDTGGWGAMITLEHNVNGRKFYSVYGHLDKQEIKEKVKNKTLKKGMELKGGDYLAKVGDFAANKNGYSHTHLQFLTETAYNNKTAKEKGYFSEVLSKKMDYLCPNPDIFVFGSSENGKRMQEKYREQNKISQENTQKYLKSKLKSHTL